MVLAQNNPVALLVISVLAAAVLLMLVVLLRARRTIDQLTATAQRLAQGDLDEHTDAQGVLGLGQLAAALNRMASQLQARFATVMQQRGELGAVLSSMSEGVLAIDPEERIISLNKAAAALLQLLPQQAIGRPIQEVVRNSTLQQFVTQTLREATPMEGELTLRRASEAGDGERHLQIRSALLRDAQGKHVGVVIVLHDVTRLRRLEIVRRDFVANVSHEVKTPVSVIKTAVETLTQHDPPDPETLQRFLDIVARQSDRLASIVDDLLSLASIEQNAGHIRDEVEPASVSDVLRRACEACSVTAGERHIALHIDCPDALQANVNAPLLEHAVVNLIDNALKYSPFNTRVSITAKARDRELVIAVTDEGRGIEAEHLPRIFERFYRTDQARSRAVGGTGLGLAIVKHIAEAHGGRVSVESLPGKGSTFRIHVPG